MDDSTHENGNGRVAWIEAAVERYELSLSRYASRLLSDPDRARDVVQDTFLKLCRQEKGALDGRLGEWLYTVCRNRAVDVRRKEHRVEALASENDVPAAGRDTPARNGPDVDRALAVLPAREQEVIRLKFQHGLTYKEIAAVTGLSVTNVGFLIHTGIKKMRAKLGGSQ